VSALLDLQDRFRRAVLENRPGLLAEDVLADGLSVERRVGIHRNNTFLLLTEALRATFPVVCRLVDERFFAYAAHDFIAARPPAHGRLHAYGGLFPEFLASFPALSRLPYVADVARLEWAMSEAFHAADALPLEPAALAAVAPDRVAGLRLAAHPSLRLVESPYPVHAIWEANQPGRDGAADLAEGPARIAVLRPRLAVVYRTLSPGAFAFVRALASGAALGPAAEAAEAQDPAFDLQHALIDTLVAGTFAGLVAA
jgi:hypothetical protein